MNWLSFFIGVLIGWLIEWIIDFFYWRRRATGSDRLAAVVRPDAESERLALGSDATVRAQAAQITALQARLADCAELERRLVQCEGDLGAERAEIEKLHGALAAAAADRAKGSSALLGTAAPSPVAPALAEPQSETTAEGLAAGGALPEGTDDTYDWAEVQGPRRAAPSDWGGLPAEPVEGSTASTQLDQAGAANMGGAATAPAAAAGAAAVWSSLDRAGAAEASEAAAAAEEAAPSAVESSAAIPSALDQAGAAAAGAAERAAQEAEAAAGAAAVWSSLDRAGAADASGAAAAAEEAAPSAVEGSAAIPSALDQAGAAAPPAAVRSSLDQSGAAGLSGAAATEGGAPAAAEAAELSGASRPLDRAGTAEAGGTEAAAERFAPAAAEAAEGSAAASTLDQTTGVAETSGTASTLRGAEPPLAKADAGAAPTASTRPDDLAIIEGIGPKIAGLLKENGISTFAALATADISQIAAILRAAGPRFQMANPATWAQQAALAAAGKWDELKALQNRLTGGLEEKRP